MHVWYRRRLEESDPFELELQVSVRMPDMHIVNIHTGIHIYP